MLEEGNVCSFSPVKTLNHQEACLHCLCGNRSFMLTLLLALAFKQGTVLKQEKAVTFFKTTSHHLFASFASICTDFNMVRSW